MVQLPERVYAMDVKQHTLAVACAGKRICVYDVRRPQQPLKQFADPAPQGGAACQLKHQLRCISVFPDASVRACVRLPAPPPSSS